MRVLLVRPASASDSDIRILQQSGWSVTHDPYLVVRTIDDESTRQRAHDLAQKLPGVGTWLLCTSAATIRAWADLIGTHELRLAIINAQESGTHFAAVGPTSAQALVDLGAHVVTAPALDHTARGLRACLPGTPRHAVLPHGALADPWLRTTLTEQGWEVDSAVFYETIPTPSCPTTADALANGDFDALVLRSPSAARAVRDAVGVVHRRTMVIVGGPTTRAEAERLGMTPTAQSATSTPESILAALEDAWSARLTEVPA